MEARGSFVLLELLKAPPTGGLVLPDSAESNHEYSFGKVLSAGPEAVEASILENDVVAFFLKKAVKIPEGPGKMQSIYLISEDGLFARLTKDEAGTLSKAGGPSIVHG